jgi:hypothetical protein
MNITYYNNEWDYWELYHKVTFDGENRLVYVNEGVTELNIRQDVYSAWKEWVQIRDHAQWIQALRTTGGDPIGGGQFTGDYYFFVNNWKMVIDGAIFLDGNLFSDDFPNPYVTVDNAPLAINRVSSLSTLINAGGGGGDTCPTAAEIRQEIDANSTQLATINNTTNTINNKIDGITTTINDIDTTTQAIDLTTQNTNATVDTINTTTQDIQNTVNDIDTLINSGAFPTLGQITDAVWNAALLSYTDSGSAGFMVSAILSAVVDANTKADETKLVVNNILLLVDEILKYDRNRTRIDKTAKTLTVYDDDGVTPIRVFNLLDGSGNLSIEEVCERDPGAASPTSYPHTFSGDFSNEFE